MVPSLIDIHSHLNFSAFKDDADEVIKRTLDASVWTILVGSQNTTSKRAVEMAEGIYPHTNFGVGVYAAVGLHPIHLKEGYFDPDEEGFLAGEKIPTRKEEFDYDFYKNLGQNKKVVAIGECGLDDHHQGNQKSKIKMQNYDSKSKNIKNKQKEVFIKQIELALEINKPLMIHCRDAHKDVIQILKSYKSQAKDKLRGNVHFFSGTWEEAKAYFALDFSISFTGVITFTNDYDEIIRKSPLDKIMVETDAPYVAPAPFRGKRNEPLYVKYVAQKIAEIKNISYEKVAETTTNNALKLFGR